VNQSAIGLITAQIKEHIDLSPDLRKKIAERTKILFDNQRQGVFKRTDRTFAVLMVFQWLVGIAAAIWISPKTWYGQHSQVHLHIWAAILLGGVIVSLPVLLAIYRPGYVYTRHIIAASQMLTSALLIHLTGGRIETHFHVFGSLAFLAFYCDWKVLTTATTVVLIDHVVRGIFWPQSVFGVLTTNHWRWLEHTFWVVFEDIFLFIACSRSVMDMFGMSNQQAQLEAANESVERKVLERTAQLDKKNEELADKVDELRISQEETEKKNKELAKKNEELIESYKNADRIFSALAEALPGTVLDNKYRLDTKIGAGGYGAVYRSTHLGLNRPVAVKIFRPSEGNATMEDLDRFRLEGVSACRVNHPNAVTVLDSGISSDGIAYLVMELLEGFSLADELYEKGRLAIDRCAEILLPVCNVLAEAHRAGIVHRDIKPDNIFLHQSKDGEIVKVVDFGIAKLLDDPVGIDLHNLKTINAIIGTPTYMSPERLNNKTYDGRSDVYSLGIMMYEMMTGIVPFDSDYSGLAAVVLMHLQEIPQSPRKLNPNITEEIESLIMRALEKNPDNRPTAQELGQELAMVLGLKYELVVSGTFKPLSYDRQVSNEDTLNSEKRRTTGSVSKRDTSSTKDKSELVSQATVVQTQTK
jgi:serine/threonine protein kinase